MKDNLFIIFKNLPQSDVPADLILNIMNIISIKKYKKIIKWGMILVTTSFVVSLWYLYSSLIDLDPLTVFKYALQTIEFDKHSIFESVSFTTSSLPQIAFLFFVINSLALGVILKLSRTKYNFYTNKFAI